MKPIKQALVGLFVLCGFVALFSLLHAQETATPTQEGAVSLTATTDVSELSDFQVELMALETTTPIPASQISADARGFYSVQNLDWPPLPGDITGLGLDVWPLGNGLYALDDRNVDYSAPKTLTAGGGMRTMAMGIPSPDDGGDTDTNDVEALSNFIPLNLVASTNLWLAITNLANNTAGLLLSNTVGDIQYEIQGKANLSDTNWISEGFVLGSEITNWTPTSVIATNQPTLFLRVRSWQDSDGGGLPDWWQLQYFGHTGVDPYGDPMGDGWSNLQKYENGWNPNTFYTPPAPPGFTTAYNSHSGTVAVSWQPSQGNVTGYTVTRYDPNTGNHLPFTFSTNVTSFVDYSPITVFPPEYGEPTYTIQASYSQGNSSTKTLTMFSSSTTIATELVYASQGQHELLAQGPIPAGTATLRLIRSDDNGYGNYTVSTFDLPVSSLSQNTAILSNSWFGGSFTFGSEDWYVQTVASNGIVSDVTQADSITWNNGRQTPVPFLDGRQQLKQNADFILRAANVSPLNYWNVYNDVVYDSISYPADYSYAGLYAGGSSSLDPFRPFEDNYFFHNFVFSTSDINPTSGTLTTGLGEGIYSIDGFDDEFFITMDFNRTYAFQQETTNTVVPAILDSTNAQWITFYPQTTGDGLGTLGITNNGSGKYGFTDPTGTTNIFGLPYLSIKFAYNNGSLQTPTLSRGNTISGIGNGGVFWQTAIPQLQTMGYYFAQPGFEPLPGDGVFLTSSTTSAGLVAGYGQSTVFAGYAKQRLLNGYANTFSYLGQYFDKAYQIDSSGNVTTNSAGAISPYGEFVATAVGPVALVTMTNWGVNERGTGIVQVVKLVLDANHDGTMDTSFNGPDNTSPSQPYVFWCNNNFDRLHTVDGSDTEQDDVLQGDIDPYNLDPNDSDGNYTVNGNRVIPCVRDLEDFSRLWLVGVTTNLLAALPSGSIVTLSWGDVGNPILGNPTIDLFAAADSNGGTGYLTNSTIALQQTNLSLCPYVGRLAPGSSVQLNSPYFPALWAGSHFIWCGVTNGSGQLTLTITDANSNVLAQTSAFIQIQDIKNMYERWTVGDEPNVAPTATAKLAVNDLPDPMQPAFQYASNTDTNTPYILHVHGWNMNMWEKDRYAETEFKRLYWQGYQGRFGEFRWPTYFNFPFEAFQWQAIDLNNFDNSELNAWKSGAGLLNLLNSLKAQYPGQVYLTAHSMGNVVAGEALRLAGTNRVVNTYVAMQGAVSAHAYDPSTVNRTTSSLPDDYAHYWTNGAPCYFNGSAGAGTYVNFFNTNDYALSVNLWQLDQDTKPHLGYGYQPSGNFWYYGVTGLSYTTADRYTIFAYCDPSWSYALGAQANVGGAFKTLTYHQVELDVSPYGFGNAHKYHSGEFRSDNAQRWQFWDEVLFQMGLKTNL